MWAYLALTVLAVLAMVFAFDASAYAKYRVEVAPATTMHMTFVCGKPTLATGKSWYRGLTGKSTITHIAFVSELPDGITIKEEWDASDAEDNSATAAVSGSTLYISANGGEGFIANSDMTYAFRDFVNLVEIEGLELIDTSNVASFRGLFYGDKSLVHADLSAWNMQGTSDISRLFYGCASLDTANVSSQNTMGIISVDDMLYGCKSLRTFDIRSWTIDSASRIFDGENLFDGVGSASQQLLVMVGSNEMAEWVQTDSFDFPAYGSVTVG